MPAWAQKRVRRLADNGCGTRCPIYSLASGLCPRLTERRKQMDERVQSELDEAIRQLTRARWHAEQPDAIIDCLQRAQDSLDRARAFAAPPSPKKKKQEREAPVPAGVEANLLP